MLGEGVYSKTGDVLLFKGFPQLEICETPDGAGGILTVSDADAEDALDRRLNSGGRSCGESFVMTLSSWLSASVFWTGGCLLVAGQDERDGENWLVLRQGSMGASRTIRATQQRVPSLGHPCAGESKSSLECDIGGRSGERERMDPDGC